MCKDNPPMFAFIYLFRSIDIIGISQPYRFDEPHRNLYAFNSKNKRRFGHITQANLRSFKITQIR